MEAVKGSHSMQFGHPSLRPCQSKADAKHQDLAMALDEGRRSCLGEDRTYVAEAHGQVRWKKTSGRVSRQNTLQIKRE